MTIEAELFDGTVLEFPDGTDPQVIQWVVKQRTQQRRAAPAATGGGAGVPATPLPENPVLQTQGPGPAGQIDPSLYDMGAIARRFVPGEPPRDPADKGWGQYIWDTAGYIWDTANIGADSMLRGAANVAGLPVDAMNNLPLLGNLLPGDQGFTKFSDYPLGGSDNLYDIVTLGGLFGAPEPQDSLQRIVARMGEEAGAALVPGVGIAARAGQLGSEAVRAMGPLARMFMESASVNPASFLAKEAAAATGAGLGAGVLNETTGNQDRSNPWIDVGGAMVGAALTGLGGAVARAGKDVVSALTGNERYASQIVRGAVADDLVSNSSTLGPHIAAAPPGTPTDAQSLIDTIMRRAPAEDVVPGFSASTADRSGDAGLAMLEAARSRSAPGAFRARADNNTRAIDAYLADLAPKETPGAFSAELEARRGVVLDDAARAADEARTAYNTAIAPLTPTMTAEGRGAFMREALQGASDRTKAALAELWAPVNASREAVPGAPFADAFAGVDAGLGRAETRRFRPPEAGDFAAMLEDGGTVALNEVTGIRSALTDAAREAERAGRSNEARIIGQYVEALDGALEAAIPASLGADYSTARAATRGFNDRFTRMSPIKETLKTDGAGGYANPASAVPRRFVQTDQGDLSATNAFFREAGDDTRAVDAFVDQLRQDAMDRGALNSAENAEAFLRANSEALERAPALRDEISRAGTAKAGLDAAQRAERDTMERLTKPGKSAVANWLSYANEKAVNAVRDLLGSRDPVAAVDELLNFVGRDPKAVEGAKAAFWKHMDASSRAKNMAAETDSGSMPLVPKKFSAFLDDPTNAAVAERLYADNPEHLASIRELADVLRTTNAGARVGNAANPSGTALMMRGQSPVSMAELGSKFYQVQLGRVSPAYVITYLVGKVTSKAVGAQRVKAYNALLDAALLDPNIAKALLQENNPANRAAMARSLGAWKFNEASTVLRMLEDGEDPDEDLRSAIMEGN